MKRESIKKRGAVCLSPLPAMGSRRGLRDSEGFEIPPKTFSFKVDDGKQDITAAGATNDDSVFQGELNQFNPSC